MIVENINKMTERPCILVAPLDWGLGHATRCIPIIKVLQEQGVKVLIPASGAVAELLQREFPSIVILPLENYDIRYSRNRHLFLLKMLIQLPRIFSHLCYEKKWLKNAIVNYKIDGVISDNRFGLHSKNIPSVYITHQLSFETGIAWLNRLMQKTHYKIINQFDECWVPDIAGENNLAGSLSHPKKSPSIPVKYLGLLSRCKKIQTEKKYRLLVLLSGPEPQRSIFEEIILSQLKNIEGNLVIVRGLPGNKNEPGFSNKNLIVHDHLPADTLSELIQQSEWVVARCGYSTVMDLVTLQQKAILVPTPAQAEQEYLADYLMQKNFFYCCAQENFQLEKAIKAAENFSFVTPLNPQKINEVVIVDWLQKIKNKINLSR